MFNIIKSCLKLCVLFAIIFNFSTAIAMPVPFNLLKGNSDLKKIYKIRKYEPIWNTNSEKGINGIKKFISSLKSYAIYHGLNTKKLAFDEIQNAIEETDKVNIEILTTDLIVNLTKRIGGYDIDLHSIYPSWAFKRDKDPYLPNLINAIENGEIDNFLRSLPPKNTKYKRLALVLKTYRAIKENGGWKKIPYGATIKENRTDERLPLIYKRLKAENYDVSENIGKKYNQNIQEIVEFYQIRNGLKPDGEIGTQTIRTMNIPIEKRINQIIANMERLRHMPDFYDDEKRVEVNIANSWLKIFKDKEVFYETAVIVGSKWRKTPFINSEIKTLVLNPFWYVPNSIASHDILKKLKENPLYLKEMGYSIQNNEDDPQGLKIDWENITAKEFDFFLRQKPSEINALGKIKFNFENPYAVYLHGTPKIELFDEEDRHLSSGCVRLKDPVKFAKLMLEDNITNWTKDAIENKLKNGKTKWITVVGSVPIYIIYDSVYFPSMDSPVYFSKDIYNYDKKLIKKLW